MHVDDGSRDGQAETGSAGSFLTPARAAIEAIEDVLELLGVDAHAGVDDG